MLSNAPYQVVANYTRTTESIQGEFADSLDVISFITGLYGFSKLPYSTIIGVVSGVAGIGSYALGKNKYKMGG